MQRIDQLDKNLKVETFINKEDICFFNALEADIYGVIYENGFRRMPYQAAQAVSSAVLSLSGNTAGGRIKFKTNSCYIAIFCKMPGITRFPHMPLTGTSGFDLYADGIFAGSFVPPANMQNGYESVIELDGAQMREIIINFPLYNDVSELYIGLQRNAEIHRGQKYKTPKPVVFYGSSITQGACASRPGLSYSAILSRKLNLDYINLGFSGNAKGEEAMAAYIAGIDMSVFVYDYDHNAPDCEHLLRTYEPFFHIIRSKNPKLPVIMISRPDIRYATGQGARRRQIIYSTFEKVKNSGDDRVFFIDGESLWQGEGWDCCTVDRCHPNDLGHWRMAQKISEVIERAENIYITD